MVKIGKVEPAEGYSAPRGWKTRQQQAQARALNNRQREEIRAIRKAHYERQKSPPEPKTLSPNPNNMTRAELIDEIKLAGGNADSKMSTAALIQRVESLRGA